MLKAIKDWLFPCEKIMREIMDCHQAALDNNSNARLKLVKACTGKKPQKRK